MTGVDVPGPIVATQWVLLFGLSFLLIIMYRQLAHMMHLTKAGSDAGGLGVGQAVEPFDYWAMASDEVRHFHFDNRATLLMISDPLCSRCEDALRDLERFASAGAGKMLRTLVLTEVDADLFASASMFERRSLEVGRLAPGLSMRLFATRVAPFLFVLDGAHKVVAKGSVSSEDEIARMANPLVNDPAIATGGSGSSWE